MTCGSLCPTDGEGGRGGTDEPEALPALMVWCFSALPVVHSSETLHLTACVFFFYMNYPVLGKLTYKLCFVENKIAMIGGRALL